MEALPCSQEPPLFPILSHMHPVHTFPLYFPNIHSNILPNMPGLPSGILPISVT
jgi:hypothetical protein